jgi:hypothetical protein
MIDKLITKHPVLVALIMMVVIPPAMVLWVKYVIVLTSLIRIKP